jgi:aspartyl protease family protein
VRRDFGVLVSDQLGDINLLGMNFLSSLRGWRIEGDVMILEP